MENSKLMSNKKKNEATAEMLWESWIVDSTDPDPEECCGEHENCDSCED